MILFCTVFLFASCVVHLTLYTHLLPSYFSSSFYCQITKSQISFLFPVPCLLSLSLSNLTFFFPNSLTPLKKIYCKSSPLSQSANPVTFSQVLLCFTTSLAITACCILFLFVNHDEKLYSMSLASCLPMCLSCSESALIPPYIPPMKSFRFSFFERSQLIILSVLCITYPSSDHLIAKLLQQPPKSELAFL